MRVPSLAQSAPCEKNDVALADETVCTLSECDSRVVPVGGVSCVGV